MPQRYPGQVASQVGVSPGAPDLSNVMQLSRSLGRNTAFNDFTSNYLKEQQKRWNDVLKQQRAERAAEDEEAAEALSNEPESESFWDKMKDFAGSALVNTIDIISRFDYASANAAKYLFDQDEENSEQKSFWEKMALPGGAPLTSGILGDSVISSLDDFNVGDIGGFLKAGWEGFTGKEKTIYSEVIKNNADRDGVKNVFDSSAYQGVMGFAADVALDPTTYIGLGLVTKPLKKAIEHKVDNELLDNLDKARLTATTRAADGTETEVILGRDHFAAMLGEIQHSSKSKVLSGTPVGLTRRERRAYRNQNAISGVRRRDYLSSGVAVTKHRLDTLRKIREAVDKSPHLLKTDSETALEIMLRNTKAEYDFAVEKYAKDAYKRALKKFDESGVPAPVGKFVEERVPVRRLMDVVKLRRILSKTDPSNVKQLEETKANLAKAEARWLEQIPEETRNKIFSDFDQIVKSDPTIKRASREAAELSRQIPIKKRTVSKTNEAERRAQLGEIQSLETRRDKLNRRKDRIAATLLLRAIRAHHQGVGNTDSLKELADLSKREQELLDKMPYGIHADMSQAQPTAGMNPDGPVGTADLDNPIANPNAPGYSEAQEMKAELSQIRARKAEIYRNEINTPGMIDAPEGLPEDFELASILKLEESGDVALKELNDVAQHKWAQAIVDAINIKADEYSQGVELENFLRERRGGPLKKGEHRLDGIKQMFGGTSGKSPKITLDGQEVLKSAKYKPILAKYVTDADRAAASKSGKYTEIKEGGTTSVPEYAAFDRLFLKEHGVTPDSARSMFAEATGKALDFDGKTVSIDNIFSFAKSNPRSVAFGGLGISIPFRGALADWTTVMRTHGKGLQADELNELRDEFAESFKKWVNDPKNYDRVRKSLRGAFTSRLNREKSAAGKKAVAKDRSISPVEREEIKRRARVRARKEVEAGLKENGWKAQDVLSDEPLIFKIEDAADNVDIDTMHREAVEQARAEYAIAEAEAARERILTNPHPNSNAAKLIARREDIKAQLNDQIDTLVKARDEAKLAREAVRERMDEQITLNAIEEVVRTGSTSLRISAAGLKLMDVPLPNVMVKATQSLTGLPILQGAAKAWQNSFSPASALAPELNLARLRMQSRTPEIIKHHLEDLDKKFSGIKPAERKQAMRLALKGAPAINNAQKAFYAELDEIVKYLDGSMKIGGDPLTAFDVNKFLPERFRLMAPKGKDIRSVSFNTGGDIIKALHRVKPEDDMMKLLWSMRIASEQAIAHKAMKNTIRETFGVKRVIRRGTDRKLDPTHAEQLVDSLQHHYGWETVDEIGNEYLFPPEAAEEIRKLFKLTKAEYKEDILRIYDKALRAWKTTVTVYNPGYYVRNGIGETIMNWFDGVTNPKHYNAAARILSSTTPDNTKEALKALEPWKKHQTVNQAMRRKMKVGYHNLTNEDIWVLYNQMGLKSGFISSEFEHFFPSAGTLRATAGGQVAKKMNDALRHGGEKYEDYFRLTHFINRMARSKHRNPVEAAREAAEYVRKYHFDYTDFTHFEKATMMRVIPFYKWTRKAMPLMTSMLFTQPGKVLLYPKAMTGMSVGTGAVDPLQDDNGFNPNYEEVVPEWMKELYSYPIGQFPWDKTKDTTYMNVATPFMDVYKMFQDPLSSTIGMVSPLLKMPAEQALGRTFDPDFDIEFDKQKDPEGARRDHLMRGTPATSLYEKIHDGKLSPQVYESFLTGLGFYENSEARQQGEMFRRNMEKKNAK